MKKRQIKMSKKWLALMRLAMGWLMLYAGLTKVLDPGWTSAGYAASAKTFPGMYEWFAAASRVGAIDFINKWGLTLLGISLLLGIGVRLSSSLGAVLMMFYYLPILDFPYAGAHSYIVSEHIIYAALLIYFAILRAGRVYGLEAWFAKTFLKNTPRFQRVWG